MIGPRARVSGNVQDNRVWTGPGQANLRKRLEKMFGSMHNPRGHAENVASNQTFRAMEPEGKADLTRNTVTPEVIAVREGLAPKKPFEDFFGR